MSLPIIGRQGGKAHAGSGFLVSAGSTGWLVTCVHLITGLRDTPPKRSLFEGGRIDVVGTHVSLPLYLGGTKRFTIVASASDGGLFDVIAVELPASEFSRIDGHGVFDLATIRAPVPGERVSATGYPGLVADPIPATTLEATLAEVEGVNLTLDVAAAVGLSGSPLVAGDDLVGIVHGDVGVAPDLKQGLALALEPLRSELFGM